MKKRNLIRLICVIIFIFFCILIHRSCNTVLDPDIYTPIGNQIIYYNENGNEECYAPESLGIGTAQDGRDHYACTEHLHLYFHFVAPEDTKRLDIYSVKIINPKTGEIIVTEDNKEGGFASSSSKYYMFNKDGTNMTSEGKKLCSFWYRRGTIPTNPFKNKKGEVITFDVEVTYKIDSGEILISNSSYNVKIGGRRYDSESFKSQILSTLYW